MCDYKTLSLIELVRLIVEKSDALALIEFHSNRALFRYGDFQPLRFLDYLNHLKKDILIMAEPFLIPHEIAEAAYDKTLDKFHNFPETDEVAKTVGCKKRKNKGVDCRLYFIAFLDHISKTFEENPPEGKIDEEIKASHDLQNLVRRHFYYSALDAKRAANPFISRYNWRLKNFTMTLYFPKSLNGQKRRQWLEEMIKNPDKLNPEDKEKVQEIIDNFLNYEFLFTLDGGNQSETADPDCCMPDEKFEIPLPQAVANRKVERISNQRRSIQALGEEKLRHMILRIFNDIYCDKYEEGKIAQEFGLSKATFSRFAGGSWSDSESRIPDLWRNTARVLSKLPTFNNIKVLKDVLVKTDEREKTAPS